MRIETLLDLYVAQLHTLYSAETQLVTVLPKLTNAVSNPQLQWALTDYLAQTEQQIQRLTQIFAQLGERPTGQTCMSIERLIGEGEAMITAAGDAVMIDAGLIAAVQRVVHYAIAGYGCVRLYAEQLGEQHSVSLLQQTLDEEARTDMQLTGLAEQIITRAADR